MTDFDNWDQTPQTTETGDELANQEVDLFGSDSNTNNTAAGTSLTNPFDNLQEQQQPFDSFLVIDEVK